MKKIYNVMMLAAVAAAALVSCAKEMDKPEAEQKGEGIQITVVTALQETKTYMVDDNTAGWSAGDKVDFVQSAAGEKVQSEAAVISEGKATFTATVANTGSFYAYYPTSSRALVNNHGEVKVLEEQYPSAADTFDPTADVLVSDYFDVAAAGSTSTDPTVLRFKRLGAFIKLKFVDNTTGNILGSEHASTIAIQNDGEGAVKLTGKIEVSPEGILATTRYYYTVTAHYEAGVFDVDDNYAYFGVLPNTLKSGSNLIFTAETEHYSISKTVTLPQDIIYDSGDIQPITVTLSDANVKTTPALQRVWGWYSEGASLWTNNVTGVSITHPDGYGMARSVAMDDEYIYLPKSSGYANVAAVSIANNASQKALSVSGISGGSNFVTSFTRIIKNTDPSVNGGKDILLLCNLTSTSSDENQLRLYAYKNGTGSAPTQIAGFCWDSANNVNDWRRYGDRFFVTGTWAAGKVYFPSYNANKSVALSISNGARTAVTQIAAGDGNSPDGIKDMTVYPESSALFITNGSVANLVSPTGGKSNGWDEYTLTSSSANGIGTWGYNFFSFKGQKYIAYARISGKKAWIEIIKDKGDLLTSLADQEGIMKAPIHSADNLDTEHETGGLADCAVRAYDGYVYVAALTRDGGFILDKLILE